MNKAISRGFWGVLFVGGLTLLGAGVANAAESSGEDALAAGNQVLSGIQLPITLSNNAVSLLGNSSSTGAGTSTSTPVQASGSTTSASTTGLGSVLGGTQALVNAALPVAVQGNAVSVIGTSDTAAAPSPAQTEPAEKELAETAATTSGRSGLLGGSQLGLDALAPVTVSGNAISVVGDSASRTAAGNARMADSTNAANSATTGTNGFLGGNQILPTVALPLAVNGNSISVVGDSQTIAPEATEPGTTPPTGEEIPTELADVGEVMPISMLAFTGADSNLLWGYGVMIALAGFALVGAARRIRTS